jgi:ABC-type uncharacterized transport system substrate-binding protein
MMSRRGFLLLAAAAMAGKPTSAEAKTLRIGLIHAGSRQANQDLLNTFREGLFEAGWSDGSNITILDRWAEGRTERLPAIVKELIGSDVAILVTAGTPATLAAKRASATIPIVLVGVDDPVALGVVDSLAQPGGNVTGLSLTSPEMIVKRLQLLRELVPDLQRLVVIVRRDPGLDQSCRTSVVLGREWGSKYGCLRRQPERLSNSPSHGCTASAAKPFMWPPAR